MRQRASARAQRAAKAQPGKTSAGSGGCPVMLGMRLSRAADKFGAQRNNSAVYGWRGWAKIAVAGAHSTTRPAYITTTRSARAWTAPRSWLINAMAMRNSRRIAAKSSITWT